MAAERAAYEKVFAEGKGKRKAAVKKEEEEEEKILDGQPLDAAFRSFQRVYRLVTVSPIKD